MSKSLYEMYQEKVGVNLKGLNEIIDEVLFLCEEEINKGNSLPYMFMIENTSDDSFKLFSLYMSTKGVIANMSIPYKSNGVTYVNVWVNEFRKTNDIPPSPPSRIATRKWWEWK